MPTVEFKEDWQFSNDGVNFDQYKAGESYEVSDLCLKNAISMGVVDDPDPKSKKGKK